MKCVNCGEEVKYHKDSQHWRHVFSKPVHPKHYQWCRKPYNVAHMDYMVARGEDGSMRVFYAIEVDE